jgi:hypothetical protein
MAASEQSFDVMHSASQLPLLFFLSISGGFVSGFLCLNAVGYTRLHCPYPFLSVCLFLLLARSAFRRLDHLWLISNLKFLFQIVESIVGWICCNNGGAFRRLDHIWLSLALTLALSHLLAPAFDFSTASLICLFICVFLFLFSSARYFFSCCSPFLFLKLLAPNRIAVLGQAFDCKHSTALLSLSLSSFPLSLAHYFSSTCTFPF